MEVRTQQVELTTLALLGIRVLRHAPAPPSREPSRTPSRKKGTTIGFTDGSRLTLPGRTPQQSAPERHRLPLVLQERDDGHVHIYCVGRDCFWSWPLHLNASPQTNGDAITNAPPAGTAASDHTTHQQPANAPARCPPSAAELTTLGPACCSPTPMPTQAFPPPSA